MTDDTKPDAKADGDQDKAPKARDGDVAAMRDAGRPETEQEKATPDGGSVQEREDVGAAADPEGPEVVHVITEVNPGTAN